MMIHSNVEADMSQSHRTDLVNSYSYCLQPLRGQIRESRNPTVLIWSIPTPQLAKIWLSAPFRSRNPTVLIWSIPTVTAANPDS